MLRCIRSIVIGLVDKLLELLLRVSVYLVLGVFVILPSVDQGKHASQCLFRGMYQ